MGELVNNF